ncbi:NAD(P)-dependent oxidoreductase [Halobacillus litoralis]|uniref:Oxidoreductase n=1 Tax=Halobacillus litoralis TaxID=45668 RepID=A0A410MDS0_9BACI|nr:NAD(P)-binding oxidoreductase [Halobacillus litoralis]QAS52847.1 oxidoreductase [Halobacillus litoralis]
MNIIVFGATGATGIEFVTQALQSGHSVTAFARTPEKLGILHNNLAVIQGDALHEDEVVAAIEGHKVVVSCLGTEGLKPSTVFEEMTDNILSGMQKHGLKRILYVASAGIYNEIPGVLGWMSQRILKNVLADHRKAVNLILAANMEYTIARPMRLNDGHLKGQYRMSEGLPNGGKEINRKDVAHFLLASLQNESRIKKTVGLAY